MKTSEKRRARFVAALSFVMAPDIEGGWANRPPEQDPGGATMYGITIGTLSDWRGRAVTPAEVRAITKAEAEAIYLAKYWNVCRCDELADGLDLCVFDLSVRGGPARAATVLQEALGVKRDGVIGPITIDAAHKQSLNVADLQALIKRYCEIEDAWDDNLPNARYNPGWETRLDKKRDASLLQAAIDTTEVAPPPTPAQSVGYKKIAATVATTATTVVVSGPETIGTWLPILGNIGKFVKEYQAEMLGVAVIGLLIVIGVFGYERIRDRQDKPA